MPNFTFATLAQAIAALQARLYLSSDPNQQFWTSAELQSYIVESLRTWNALTSFWRAEMVFSLQKDVWWYDLPSQLNSIRPFTLTDSDLIQTIEYHLLEPLTSAYPLSWTGSNQFSVSDILGAIERSQNEAIGTTGCTLTRFTAGVTPGRIFLPDTTLVVRRIVWIPVAGLGFVNRPLAQSDSRAQEFFDSNWTTAGQEPPLTWLQSTQPPLGIDLDRVSPCAALVEVISANSGASMSSQQASKLSIPDDWAWVVKFGALADLFVKESHGKDPLREKYCRQRFEEGMGLLSTAPSVLSARLNNIPLNVDAVRNGDDFDALWQSAASGAPKVMYTAGLNLVAFGPAPDSNTAYSATISTVQNIPVPAGSNEFLQIGRDQYDVVIDYAQHLAMIKTGGAEFLATVPLWQNMLRAASLYNSKLSGMGFFQKQMEDLAQLQEQRDPTYGTVKPAEVEQ